ncbi:MAG TPA: DUF309 domain-containing protein [Pseudonocardia sp.]|jgi:uncharacterized protein|nr:DUF309 domain-containing protein [Pseudonocardia sp.]
MERRTRARGEAHSRDRDRDPAGRARNARPRDAAGRPLPHDAEGVERLPEDLVRTAEETVTHAQQLLDAGRPFHAHEVLEAAWKSADDGTRELWRALAQLAVGLTHAQRGNARGAVALLRRGADGVERWVGEPPAGLDLPGLVRHAADVAGRIEAGGTGAVAPGELRPRLRRD